MQTFLPYSNFAASAKVLDSKRLGKQRVETKQIVLALTVPTYGWKHHPATKMWRHYVPALAAYGYLVCEEWRRRGYEDSLLPFFAERLTISYTLPPWMGDPNVHASHRSNLLAKNPVWYSQFEWSEPPGMQYVWPVN